MFSMTCTGPGDISTGYEYLLKVKMLQLFRRFPRYFCGVFFEMLLTFIMESSVLNLTEKIFILLNYLLKTSSGFASFSRSFPGNTKKIQGFSRTFQDEKINAFQHLP